MYKSFAFSFLLFPFIKSGMIFRSNNADHLLLNKFRSAPNYMKTKKILITAGIALTALLVIQMLKSKKAEKRRLSVVAEEGYETAEDILFPKKKFIRLG
jgi:hypothetical protein